MGMKFKRDDTVIQKVTPIQGVVSGVEIVDDEVAYKVAYVGEDGQAHERYFKEDEIDAASGS